MPRINVVKKSRKDQGQCGRCGDPLPKGSAYRWAKPRRGGKMRRCMKSECGFRPSDLSSSKMAAIWDVQPEVVNAIEQAESVEDVKAALEPLVEVAREVSEQYQESADNVREYFPSHEGADEWEEWAYGLEEWAEAMESLDWDEEEPVDDPPTRPEEPDWDEFDDEEEKEDAHDEYESALDEYENEFNEYEDAIAEHAEAFQTFKEEAITLAEECPV